MVRLANTVEKTMFYGAKPETFGCAKELRSNQTEAEKKLWSILRKNQILGLRFKQQHPIGIFIADFYCHSIKLVIEVDGDIHLKEENREYDENRTAELERLGITVLRFSNEMVIKNINKVREEILMECERLINKL